MYLSRLLLLIALLIVAEPASALRCGNVLVNDGDHKARVLRYCGEPTAVQVRTIYRSFTPRYSQRSSARTHGKAHSKELLFSNRTTVEIIVEEWTYNFGPRRLMQMIRFENGFVSEVKQLRTGYLE
jgi:hypothetical protein